MVEVGEDTQVARRRRRRRRRRKMGERLLKSPDTGMPLV
jgi:hypothetical protein